MDPLTTRVGLSLLGGLTGYPSRLDITRQSPSPMATRDAVSQLADGYEQRVQQIQPGVTPDKIGYNPQTVPPGLSGRLDALKSGQYSQIVSHPTKPAHRIDINPNADRAYFAHELGHAAAGHTDAGMAIRKLRDNPRLTGALLGAAALTTGSAAALTPGDDDLAGSIGLAYAAYAPTLIDEALASKNALAILQNAQMRATPMQRARLAGGFLSYMGTPLVLGSLSSGVGNMLDQT